MGGVALLSGLLVLFSYHFCKVEMMNVYECVWVFISSFGCLFCLVTTVYRMDNTADLPVIVILFDSNIKVILYLCCFFLICYIKIVKSFFWVSRSEIRIYSFPFTFNLVNKYALCLYTVEFNCQTLKKSSLFG